MKNSPSFGRPAPRCIRGVNSQTVMVMWCQDERRRQFKGSCPVLVSRSFSSMLCRKGYYNRSDLLRAGSESGVAVLIESDWPALEGMTLKIGADCSRVAKEVERSRIPIPINFAQTGRKIAISSLRTCCKGHRGVWVAGNFAVIDSRTRIEFSG